LWPAIVNEMMYDCSLDLHLGYNLNRKACANKLEEMH